MKRIFADSKLCISWAVVSVLMGIFTLARVVLLVNNGTLFVSLSGTEIASAFLHGLQFDFYMTALCLGPVIFLLNLPVKSTKWIKFWAVVLLAELVFITGFLVGDLIYFPKVGRHIAEEIIQVSNDWGFVISYMFTRVWWGLLILLVGFGVVVYGIFIYINRIGVCNRTGKKTMIVLSCISVFVLIGLRGHLGGGKPLGVADVYRYAHSAPGAALTLNGAFTAYQVGRKGIQEFTNNYPLQEAIENTQKLFIAKTEKIISEEYPLMRQAVAPAQTLAQKHNVFIVLLEGWHPYYIDELSHQGFGVTPVFDEILKDGVHFSNAYAVGQRSIFGFAAVLAGVPLVPGLPLFGYGLETTALSPMPAHFANAGYYTFFAQTSHRNSYRLCSLASYLGMQESYGWEDIPQRLPYQEKAPFGYDYDALQFAADKIAEHPGQPFMGMVFTGITHEPFTSTLPQFDKYPYNTWEHGFLNTLSFADWSIGELLARAKKDGWFDNTIFVFVADHTSGGPADHSLKNRFKIPLVIYAPKLLPAQQMDYVVSQLDLSPTLYKLTGLMPVYTAFGRDMFDTSVERAALVSEGNNVGLITQQGAIRHTGKQLLSVELYQTDFDVPAAEKLLLSLDKTAYVLLKNNRWYDPQEGSNE